MIQKIIAATALVVLASSPLAARAQAADSMADSMAMSDSMPMPSADSIALAGMRAMTGMKPMTAEEMMRGPLGISMDRMGSGTTWIPDAAAMPSRRAMVGSWMIMGHGFAFAQYDHQSGKRGRDQLGSLNWAMLMATKDVAGGRFQARTMLSLDALGVSTSGYPLLLQSGESLNGGPIHDRQHPHDFWMELGALYQRAITKTLGLSVYAAPSGEPALGPVAFMHRPSAMDNPMAPITHHWQDATHISFGVLTAGIYSRRVQLESSIFNGREPDSRRWNFDRIRLDSYSARLTLNPDSAWSFSAGYGYLKSPEALNPGESMHRVTASLLHGAQIGRKGQWSSAVIIGANAHAGDSRLSRSALIESEASIDGRNTFFGRAEWVQKRGEDLALTGTRLREIFPVGALQLGYIREITRKGWATLGFGASGTVNFVTMGLVPDYGSAHPAGAVVFFRVRPARLARRK